MTRKDDSWPPGGWDSIPNASELDGFGASTQSKKTQWEINQERIARVGSSRCFPGARPVVEVEAGTWDYPTCGGGCGEEVLPQYTGVNTPEGSFCQACAQDMMNALLRSPLGLLVELWILSYVRKRNGG